MVAPPAAMSITNAITRFISGNVMARPDIAGIDSLSDENGVNDIVERCGYTRYDSRHRILHQQTADRVGAESCRGVAF